MPSPNKPIYRKNEKGCNSCDGRGYKGRAGLYELLIPSPELNELVQASKSDDEIRKQAYAEGMSSLQNEGFRFIENGVTSIEELKRIL